MVCLTARMHSPMTPRNGRIAMGMEWVIMQIMMMITTAF